jgi:hypothetical protein
METLIGTPDGPNEIPTEVLFFTKPVQGSDDPLGPLVWTGTLALAQQVNLTSDSFAELVETARNYLDEAYPNEAIPVRVFIVPGGQVDDVRPEQIAEVSVWPPGDHVATFWPQ